MDNVWLIIEVKNGDHGEDYYQRTVAVRLSNEEEVKQEVAFLNENIVYDMFRREGECYYEYKSIPTKGYQGLNFASKNNEIQEFVFKNDLPFWISNAQWNLNRHKKEGNKDFMQMTLEQFFFCNYEKLPKNTLPIERAKELFREEIALNGVKPHE